MLDLIQLTLLENLSYTYDSQFPYNYLESYIGYSLRAFIESIDLEDFIDEKVYNSYITGLDWKNIIQAFLQDETLLNLKLITTFRDKYEGGGGAFSYLVKDNQTNEAIVVFKGTQSMIEWTDNFHGGGYLATDDHVSTPCQLNALKWFNSIYDTYHLENNDVTIIGHSKGGNKAKYITLVTGKTNRCISFDGQGFSDGFFKVYHEKIIENQHKIYNMALDNDFVNILLSDIGKKEYYQGFDVGSGNGGFLENHCPNSFLTFKDGIPLINQSEEYRLQVLDQADRLFNSMSRNFSHESRTGFLYLLGELYITAISKKDIDYAIDLLLAPQNKGFTSYLIAYFIEYTQKSSMRKEIIDFLKHLHLDALSPLLNFLLLMVESNIGDGLIKLALHVSDTLPDYILQWITNLIERKTNYKMSIYKLMFLIDMIQDVPNYQRMFDTFPDGKDLTI